MRLLLCIASYLMMSMTVKPVTSGPNPHFVAALLVAYLASRSVLSQLIPIQECEPTKREKAGRKHIA